MTFADIYDEVITARFKSAQTPQIKRWINLRESQIWAAAEWPWKITAPTVITVDDEMTIFSTLPEDFQTPLAVYDDLGNKLRYMIQSEFDATYQSVAINDVTGRATDFKFQDGTLTFGPALDAAYDFSFSYYRKPIHFDEDRANYVVGPMTEDTDEPIFDTEWHEIMTIGAISTGLKIENDPTWQSLEQEFGIMLAGMVDHYLPSVATAGNMQYGADCF